VAGHCGQGDGEAEADLIGEADDLRGVEGFHGSLPC
jgi:hypothetical protein